MLHLFNRKSQEKQNIIDEAGMKNKYVIPDIHGCSKTFEALLKKIDLQKEDGLFLLGDYIDRGQDSAGVINQIINLKENGYRVYPLLGNHEKDALTLDSYQLPRLVKRFISGNIENHIFNMKSATIYEKYKKFINSLELYIELDDFILVHGGFDFSLETPFCDIESILWIRNFNYDENKAKGKTIIHGHTPKRLSRIKKAITNKYKIIGLDNGCVYHDMQAYAKLLCLELNTYNLTIQNNIDY